MTHLDEFTAELDFALDDFQIEGCRAVEADRGVLVAAPTGSGKTIVGEFAISIALSRGTKCFYTTPIKALSNQKYNDLVAIHGEDAVGLLTGDVSINAGAEVVVMTTEVLRNMIYAKSNTLDRLTHVVMDEIHFLADRDRGAVWEEIILNLHESVNIIGLSATVSNSEEFGNWLNSVRGDTAVIVSEHRPVPLDQWMLVGRKVYPLFEPGSDGRVNGELMHRIERLEEGTTEVGRDDYRSGKGFRSRSEERYRPLGRPEVLQVLNSREMLPAIVFIFSRAGCDGALAQCHRSRKVLTTPEEAEEIKEIIDAGVAGIPEEDLEVLRFRQWRTILSRGFAAHHAGMLPAFRHIVEKLFVQGLVRAVFATETLALGINMPARTVVLEKLVKFNGEAHVDLTPGQYTQFTGRAGRRGIDTLGNAVVQWAPAMDPKQVAGLASTRTYPLISTFAPGYNMAVNLLGMIGFDEAMRLLEKSFAQYQSDRSVVDEVRGIERAEQKVAELREQLEMETTRLAVPADEPAEQLAEYVSLRQQLKEDEKSSRRHAIEQRSEETVSVLAQLQIGDVVALPGRKHPQLAVVVTPANQSRDPRPWVTTETGWSGRIDASGISRPPIQVGRMNLPRNITHHPRKNTKFVVDTFRREYYKRPKKMKRSVRFRDSKKVVALREQVYEHPVHMWPAADRELLARTGEKLNRAQRKRDSMQSTISEASDTLGRQFERIIGLLTELDYVDLDNVVTEEGERLALIHSSSDLLVAQCLKRQIWDELDPAELAGSVSLCAFELRKTTGGEPQAPTDAMVDAMNATQRVWVELASDEQRHQVPVTKEPDAQFALAMHQWTAGAPLGYCLAAANESGAELTAGDFVRSVLQVIDLLQQVAKTGYTNQIRRTARRAIDAARRGVVAVGT